MESPSAKPEAAASKPKAQVTAASLNGQMIHSAPPRATDTDEGDDGLSTNRCGHAANHANILRVTITKTDLVGNISYHDFKTDAFRPAEMLKASENRAVFRFTDEDREEKFLVITGGPAGFSHEDLGVGKYAAKIRIGGLDSIWADGVRIVDVAVTEEFPR